MAGKASQRTTRQDQRRTPRTQRKTSSARSSTKSKPRTDDNKTGPASDSMSLYMEEVSQIDLLTAEQEISLARDIELGEEARQALQNDDLAPDAVHHLQQQVKRGNRARDLLITANFRLVISITKRYVSKGVSFMDLVQEGNIGLIKAVDKFDYKRGYKFSTYATWWIRQAITRALADQGRTIRVPVHMCERINRLGRIERELSQQLGRDPSREELAKAMETTPEGIDQIEQFAQHPLSLEMPVGDEQDSNLADFVEDQSRPTLSESATRNWLQERMQDVLTSLDAREGQVIKLRFGLYGGKAHTLEEVGQKFGVTRERIRQIEATALRKLRHPRRSRRLREFL